MLLFSILPTPSSHHFYNAFTSIQNVGTDKAIEGIRFFNSDGKEVGEGEDGGWRLYEDREGKPGWISERANSVIRFHVNVEDKDTVMLKIGVLKSYEGMGRAAVSVLRPGESWAPEVIVNGHIGNHFSQIFIERICITCERLSDNITERHYRKGWGVKGEPAEVNIRSLDNKKFKIVFVIPF